MGMDRGKMGGERKRPGTRGERGSEEEMELEGEWDKDGGRKTGQREGGMNGGERDDGRWYSRKGGRKDKEEGRREGSDCVCPVFANNTDEGRTDRWRDSHQTVTS